MAELMLVKVTQKGQVTIPQELREALGIEPGDYVALRLLTGGVFLCKASVSPAVKAEDVLPHLVAPHGSGAKARGAKKDKDLNSTIEDIEQEVYRESTGG
jgi:AbrB family looped-hinge helix DNA binding protein